MIDTSLQPVTTPHVVAGESDPHHAVVEHQLRHLGREGVGPHARRLPADQDVRSPPGWWSRYGPVNAATEDGCSGQTPGRLQSGPPSDPERFGLVHECSSIVGGTRGFGR